ncbi:MAG: Rieske (2Fe-2S) protein, partial [Caulobacterales bacterium]
SRNCSEMLKSINSVSCKQAPLKLRIDRPPMTTVTIPLSEIPAAGSCLIEREGRRIVLCRSPLGIHAMNEMCPHQERSLEGARVRGTTIMCPHHGARFSLEDGKSMSPPLTPNPITMYPSRINGDVLEVDLP